MHRVYMCSNLKYPFELERIEQIMACTNVNSACQVSIEFYYCSKDGP
jgi:hypothetical protein